MKAPMKPTVAAVFAALVVAGASTAAPVSASSAYEAQRQPAEPARKRKLHMEEIHVQRGPDSDVFSGIVPCMRVARSVWDAAQAGKAYSLQIHLKYESGGKTAVKNVQVPLKSMAISRHHESTDAYVVVGTVVNVATKPVDAGAKVTGNAHLDQKPATR